jgi:hypothetical protein
VLRVRIDMGVMREFGHGLLGIDFVRNLVALCRAVRVLGSRAEVVRAASAPAAAPAGALDYESAQCDAERPARDISS